MQICVFVSCFVYLYIIFYLKCQKLFSGHIYLFLFSHVDLKFFVVVVDFYIAVSVFFDFTTLHTMCTAMNIRTPCLP